MQGHPWGLAPIHGHGCASYSDGRIREEEVLAGGIRGFSMRCEVPGDLGLGGQEQNPAF